MNTPIKIAIAEDFELERLGLITLLEKNDNIKVVLDTSNGKEMLEGLRTIDVDVVLLDIEMAIMGGRECFDEIKSKFPSLKVIMLTEHFSDPYIREFINKGANAFLSKNNKIERVIETIIRVHVHGHCFDTIVSNILAGTGTSGIPFRSLAEHPDLNLTAREIEIIRYLCMGKNTREISELLNIEMRTVETHRRNIWEKTGIKNNIPDLIEFAFKHNLISI